MATMVPTDDAGADALALMRSLRQRRVALSLRQGELHFVAPRGVLRDDDISRITSLREEIVAHLQRASTENDEHHSSAAPLAFSQLKHWHFHSAHARLPLRDVAAAVRLGGRLEVRAMAQSHAKVVGRHDALRSRIVRVDGSLKQEVAVSTGESLQVSDLRGLPPSARIGEARQQIDQLILQPVRFDTGPLFGIRLITLQEDQHLLVVATEHIISDAVSVNILLKDLLAFYLQIVGEQAVPLPAVGVQFPDYAAWQQHTHTRWLAKHGEYWQGPVKRGLRMRFPDSAVRPVGSNHAHGVVSLEIEHGLTARLRDRCRAARTTLAMGMFAAYAACALRWCGVAEAAVGYQIDGRMSSQVRNTVGFFTSTLYLCISLDSPMTFNDLLRQATDEYSRAYEHADSWYLATVVPAPGFIGNTLFNWVPQPEASVAELGGAPSSIAVAPFRFENPSFAQANDDREPLVLLADTGGGLVIDIHFPLRRFSDETMRRFGRNLLHFVTTLAQEPGTCIMQVAME